MNKLRFITLLLCFNILLWSLPTQADNVDSQVDRVQERFNFVYPDGRGIDHDTLKKLLLKRNGSGTFLQQGLSLIALQDTKKRFDQNQYYEATSELNEGLIAAALGYPTLPKVNLQGALQIAKEALELKLPKSSGVIGIYDKFEQLHAGYQLVNAVAERGQANHINALVKDYVAHVTDPDKDQEEWSDYLFDEKAKAIERSFKARGKTFDVHEFCRAQWKMKRQLDASLSPEIIAYSRNFISSLPTGSTLINKFSLIRTMKQSDYVRMIRFSNDGKIIYSQGTDAHRSIDMLRLWDAQTGLLKRTLSLVPVVDDSREVVFSPDQKFLARSYLGSGVELLDARTGKRKYLLNAFGMGPDVVFSPDSKTLVSAGELEQLGSKVQIWDVQTGKLKRTLKSSNPIAFAPDGSMIATYDTRIRLWNARTGKQIRTIESRSKYISSLTFSPNGKVIAATSVEQPIQIFDVNTGILNTTIGKPHTGTNHFAFSPDGQVIAADSVDNYNTIESINFWQVETGDLIQTMKVSSISFSPDGTMLATQNDNKVQIWKLK